MSKSEASSVGGWFEDDLIELLNSHGKDQDSKTPDFILMQGAGA